MNKIDKYDVYDIVCVIKQSIEENIQLEKENERLRGIVKDYDNWIRKMNGQYQENIAGVFKQLINRKGE